MSAQHSFSTVLPSAARDVGGGDSDSSDDASHQLIEGSPSSGELNFPLGPAELANLLANGQWGVEPSGSAVADTHSYDGHVLTLDTGVLPDIDSTLDVLTSSHDLFDVPALDVSGPDDTAAACQWAEVT